MPASTATRSQILEMLRVRYPEAKVSVRRATVKAAGGVVAYIATVKNLQKVASVRDLPRVMILSFDSAGNEIQNSEV
jgi:hypothetical protein